MNGKIPRSLSEKTPRRANFDNGGHAWILEEVSMKYDTQEPFIQYVKFDDPKKQKALRFGSYSIFDGKRVKVHGGVCFEIRPMEDLRKKMGGKETPAIRTALKEMFG